MSQLQHGQTSIRFDSESQMSPLQRITEQYIRDGEEQEKLKVSDDSDSGTVLADGLLSRDRLYSTLLDNYIRLTLRRNRLKEIHKWIFFWVMNLLILVSCVCCFVFIFSHKPSDGVVSIIGAFSSLITTLVAIPLIIANYLFNIKEDDQITSFILETEKQDYSQRELLKELYAKAKAESKDEKPQEKKDEAPMRMIARQYAAIPTSEPEKPDDIHAELSSLNSKIARLDDEYGSDE